MYYLYLLRCVDDTLYTGITNDVKRRFLEHQSKDPRGAKYTKSHPVKEIACVFSCEDRKQASKAEYHVKKLSKKEKEAIIASCSLAILDSILDLPSYHYVSPDKLP